MSKKTIFDNSSIINFNAIYTHEIKREDKKRINKRSCIYYRKIDSQCVNHKCHKTICDTAKDCTLYKRKS